MRIKIEGVEYKIPSSLMEITLADRIAFDKQHGKAITEQLKKIIEMKDGPLKEMEFSEYHCGLACKTLSFFGKIPLNIIENTSIGDVLAIYHASMKQMTEEINFQDKEHQLQQDFVWEGDSWHIATPELKPDSKFSFGEFLDAKQVVKNFYEMSQEKWEALIGLCCIYFRKVGEPYTKELSAEGSDRYKLMQNLPLPYALHVGFFLTDLMDTCSSIYHCSTKPVKAEQPDPN